MDTPRTADDILPLLAALSQKERIRLIHLIAQQPNRVDATAYATLPPGRDEFSNDDDSLAWDAEGWEEFN